MKANVIFISLIGAIVCSTLFFGKYISKTFLATPIKIVGVTSDQMWSATTHLGDGYSRGTASHELVHALKNFKIVVRDIPFAAAVGYLDDYNSGELCDPWIQGTVESILESQKRMKQQLDSSEFYQLTFYQIDSIAEKNFTRLESTKSYMAGARLAALAISLEATKGFLEKMALGAPATMAWKSLIDNRYNDLIVALSWSRFSFPKVVYPDLLERSYQFCLIASEQDIKDLEYFLSIRSIVDSVYILDAATTINYIFDRIKRGDFNKIYQLGSETKVTRTRSDTSASMDGRFVRWKNFVPTYRLNSKLNTGSTFLYKDSLISYIRSTLYEFQGFMHDSISIEIGEFDRNIFENGYVYIQPSNLIPNEAMTTVQIENFQVVSAIITFNSNINYSPIIGQEMWHSVGMLGHSNSSFPTIFKNPLPRPLHYFQTSSYEHFLSNE